MSSGRNDIRLIELKDTISQLNQTIRVQTEMIKDLRKTIEEHHASDEKKDQIISNLQAEISYLKAKLFGASSEKRRKEDLPGQMSLFDELMEEEPAKEIEPEYIEIKAHERKRKKKPDLNEQFRDIPVRQEFVDTLTEEQKTCSICGTKMVEIGHELIRSEVILHRRNWNVWNISLQLMDAQSAKKRRNRSSLKITGFLHFCVEVMYLHRLQHM